MSDADADFEALVEKAARYTFAAAAHAPTPDERSALIVAGEYITEVRFSRFPTDWDAEGTDDE